MGQIAQSATELKSGRYDGEPATLMLPSGGGVLLHWMGDRWIGGAYRQRTVDFPCGHLCSIEMPEAGTPLGEVKCPACGTPMV